MIKNYDVSIIHTHFKTSAAKATFVSHEQSKQKGCSRVMDRLEVASFANCAYLRVDHGLTI